MSIIMMKNIPLAERPRERSLKYGCKNLSNEDLIAIILKSGTKNSSVKEISSKILIRIENIQNLKEISVHELTKIKGIGNTKAITLIAAIELGKRVHSGLNSKEKIKINNAADVYNIFKKKIASKKQEYFYGIYLNNKKEILATKMLFKGSLDMSIAHPREIFKEALKQSAATIICVHNHPSGDPNPSKQDISLTKRIKASSLVMGIKLDDHIIIGDKYFSFFENNLI